MLTFRGRRAASGWSWWRTAVPVLMVLVFAGATAPSAGAAPTATATEPGTAGAAIVYSRLENANSGMCLVVRGTADGAPAVQTPCSYYRDQNWEREYVRTTEDGPLYRLRNQNSRMCLVVRGRADGARAVQTHCANFADQLWLVGPSGTTNPFHIINGNSFQCLVVRGGANGNPAVQTRCGNWQDQIWYYSVEA
jgi:hypothetical protein